MSSKWSLSQKISGVETQENIDLSPSIINILWNRGYTSLNEILDYLKPSLFDLYSPFLFKDMKKVVERIKYSLKNKEKILLYGDYDVDGITGTSLLYKALKKFGFNVVVYIPTRDEGYGLHEEAIRKAADNSIKLIITVDCGITSIKEILFASSYGIDVIVTDHHEPLEELPKALGILNPKVEGSGYPFRHLAGVGVAFKLLQALYQYFDFPQDMEAEINYLDIVALGTIADVVPLIGENRIIVKYGLKVMRKTKHVGMRALLQECGLEGTTIDCGKISFYVAPRINAAGRMDTARLALNLFLEEDHEKALVLAKELSCENQQRQLIESKILADVENMLSSGPIPEVIVLSSPVWNHGVIGIVASRLVERYQRPVFLIAEEGELGKGSARGIPNYHVLEELTKQSSLLIKFGGHKQAAGFTIPVTNISTFRDKVIKSYINSGLTYKKVYYVESIVPAEEINMKLQYELTQLAPFGFKNPAPILMTRDLSIKNVSKIGKSFDHLKLKLVNNNLEIEALAFKKGNDFEKIKQMKKIDILYTLELNEFKGNKKLQANILDYREAGLETPCSNEVQTKYISWDLLYPNKIELTRDMLVDFYLLLKSKTSKNNILKWEDKIDVQNQLHMIKIFEELGLVTWLSGTGPFVIKINFIKKTDLSKSLRFRMLNKRHF